MISLFFISILTFAHPYYDRNLQALVAQNPKGFRACIPLLFKADGKKKPLPNPDQAIVDYYTKQILFSVKPTDVGRWPVVANARAKAGNGETEKLRIDAIRNAPKNNIWIDVTQGILFAQKLFKLEESGPTFPAYSSVKTAVGLTGVATIDKILLTDYFSLHPFFIRGFFEISSDQKNQAELAVIFDYNRSGPLSLILQHVFHPIPGTEWAFHKPGLDIPRFEK